MNISFENKNIIIMGVANKRSIAWGIAEVLHKAGANLIFTYGKERSKKNIEKLVETLENQNHLILPCDVTDDEAIHQTFNTIKEKVGIIHGVAHSVAFANKEELEGEFVDTSREGFLLAQNVSAYSLTAIAREARPLMTEGGSIVTISYLGGERVVRNYNVMGVAKASLEASVMYLANDLGKDDIRVNAISAGPLRTLSAKGVSDFNSVVKVIEERSPLRRSITLEEVGNTALFLFSELSTAITGEVLHVDSGYHTIGI
ncbi:enoyl-[acyl-carrier protein] reductase I [Pullulanibacillus pueri]|uniref:Enoyl-[acyl-carrier-protein] reductase [NADH] n=1 Tax=Pullulanibacillus pueri TaxID=1437324 RepID=A0A8J2ZWN5_9BACL|nr:enoyl-ACP reductase FabI [Pullulanibacillus pueri]MBM7680606.1 enoyl-[acyl-carrier protein] reductase I [Pullulanibacillus pueri]GGH83956.1 enoyl-[acyl-carrier-protein] reductase [NADH] FabI [Pullulanibacillus pueri]